MCSRAIGSLGGLPNALTYADYTAWGAAERAGGAYGGGSKRRSRSEWLMQRDAHPALISEDDAELILAALEVAHAVSPMSGANWQRDRASNALLGDLLFSPDGTK
ncbi:hypothetical protein [Luteimonas sp. gir]|uniref:hypothetical protein n=1 Tax=Luteimonas sp. gir TaxID=3127960 RepID=UPI003075B430